MSTLYKYYYTNNWPLVAQNYGPVVHHLWASVWQIRSQWHSGRESLQFARTFCDLRLGEEIENASIL